MAALRVYITIYTRHVSFFSNTILPDFLRCVNVNVYRKHLIFIMKKGIDFIYINRKSDYK